MSATILLILRFIMTASLYIFLGLAVYLIWQEMKGHSLRLASRQPPQLTLIRQIGAEEKAYRIVTPEIIIGRDPSCDHPLDDHTVSAHHTRLFYRQGHWWADDLQSTNGTFLNQEPISTPHVLTTGDLLGCGQVEFSILIGAGSPEGDSPGQS